MSDGQKVEATVSVASVKSKYSRTTERAAQTIRGVLWHGQGLGGHNNYRAAEEALAELLSEIAALRRDNEHAYNAWRELTEGRP